MNVVIYARVSTAGQDLDQQLAACERFCQYKGLDIAARYQDIASGAKAVRPELETMLQQLRGGLVAGVVVFRLDRLGRRARDLALLIDELESRGIHVYSIQENFDTSTAIGRAMREIVMVMAQLERENISEATKQRLAALRAAGKPLGRPTISKAKARHARDLLAGGLSVRAVARETGLSVGSVSNIRKSQPC